MYPSVEPRVRCVVADSLGVDADELAPGVSLTDDLAADSLDLVELALALEAEFQIAVPDRILERVRTYGDLVHAIAFLSRERREGEAWRGAEPVFVWTQVEPANGKPDGMLRRTDWLTPYTVETIAEDALRAGRGAHLEVTVAAGTDEARLARVQEQFARLGKHGVKVNVRRDDCPDVQPVHPDGTVPAAQPDQLSLLLRPGPRSVVTPPSEVGRSEGSTMEAEECSRDYVIARDRLDQARIAVARAEQRLAAAREGLEAHPASRDTRSAAAN